MSDSLRDQLLNAGFTEPGVNDKPARKKAKNRKVKARSPATQTSAVQIRPLAGHTYVPTSKPKKQKAKKPPAIRPRTGTWGSRNPATDTHSLALDSDVDFAKTQKRQLMNAKIKQLIEANELRAFMGEIIYRCTLENNLRELLVTEAVNTQLANGDLATTKLHGYTRLIPTATAADISSIDPQWPICLNTHSDSFSVIETNAFHAPADLTC